MYTAAALSISTAVKYGGNNMTEREMILKELQRLRADMGLAVQRIEYLELENAQLSEKANLRAEAADAQSTYTAMMTDTLLEV